jgi:hypothetical protein
MINTGILVAYFGDKPEDPDPPSLVAFFAGQPVTVDRPPSKPAAPAILSDPPSTEPPAAERALVAVEKPSKGKAAPVRIVARVRKEQRT